MAFSLQCIAAGLGVSYLVFIAFKLRHFKRGDLLELAIATLFFLSLLLYLLNGGFNQINGYLHLLGAVGILIEGLRKIPHNMLPSSLKRWSRSDSDPLP